MSNNQEPTFKVQRPRRTLKARTDLAALVAEKVVTSAFAKGQKEVSDACAAFITAGNDLAAEEQKYNSAKASLAEARKGISSKTKTYEKSFNVLSANVSAHATLETDVPSLGLKIDDPASHFLESPIAITGKWSFAKDAIIVQVKQPKGFRTCIIEMATDANGVGPYVLVDGDGLRRELTGKPPGTYWFQARNTRSKETSAPTAPVKVVVK